MDQGQRTAGPAAPGRLDAAFLLGIDRRLADADRLLASRYPGDAGSRQPLHTVYVPADQTDVDTPARWGAAALDVLDAAVPDAASAARVTGLGGIDEDVHARVRAKLAARADRGPADRLRGRLRHPRPTPRRTRRAPPAPRCPAALDRPAPPRRSSASGSSAWRRPTRRRGLRTLDLFLGALLAAAALPDGFLLTLPKVTSVDQVGRWSRLCERLEGAHGCGRPARLRDPGRDHRRRSSAPTAPPPSPG